MVRRITVRTLPGHVDSRGEAVKKDAHDIGVKNITNVSVSDVYLFEGDISNDDICHKECISHSTILWAVFHHQLPDPAGHRTCVIWQAHFNHPG